MDNEFSRVVDALPGLVWTALPDGYTDRRNRHWCEYTNLNLDKSCGRRWQTAIHPEDLPELLGRWRSILGSGEPGEMQARLRRFDGEYHWLLFRAYPLPDASGQVEKWCGMNTDIEDQWQARGKPRLRQCLRTSDKSSGSAGGTWWSQGPRFHFLFRHDLGVRCTLAIVRLFGRAECQIGSTS